MENFQDLKQANLDHVFVSLRPWSTLTADDGYNIFTAGQGCRVTDIRGKTYLDYWGTIQGANLLGYGRKEVADAAYRQMLDLHFSPTHDGNIPKTRLAQRLAAVTPGDLSRVFFANGGTEAVETALKIARKYHGIGGFPNRFKIISPSSYHGSTLGAMATGADISFHWEDFEPLPAGYLHVEHPWCARCALGLRYPACEVQCARQVEQLILDQGPESVAVFIDTPVSSFNHVSPPEYWPMLRSICDKYGILLIFDCIACGLGRTGKWFAAEHFNVVPDIMVLGKGLAGGYLPISAAVVTRGVARRFEGGPGEVLMHSFTFEGHAAACAAALTTLSILGQEDLVERSRTSGDYLYGQLKTLYRHKIVGDVRGGLGLMANIELCKDRDSGTGFSPEENAEINRALQNKLMAAGLWGMFRNPIPVYPPLCVTRDEIDEMVAGFDRAIGEIARQQ